MKLNLWRLLGAGHLPEKSRAKLGIVSLLYFIEGSPPAILWEVLPVYFRRHGVSLRAIGGLRLLELPYSLKVLWSPVVHRYGDRRVWIAACMFMIAMLVGSLPYLEVAPPGWMVLVLILGLTTFSATQDIAIDSYTVGLVGREEEGAANGVRASAYRVALVFVGSGMIFLADALKWSTLYLGASAVFAFLGLAALSISPLDLPARAREEWLKGFFGWIWTWKAVPLILFVLLYKLGEFSIGPMIKPFWVDQGRSNFEIGLVPTTFGIVLSVAGSLAGGAYISRFGTFHGVWFLGLLQAVSNLGYALVAWLDLGRFAPYDLSMGLGAFGPYHFSVEPIQVALYSASVIESFSGGLGTAAFLAFLMNVCEKEHATVQYAFLSSVFSLTGRLVGALSGLGAERFGYGNYFALTFLMALPAYLFVPWVKRWIRE